MKYLWLVLAVSGWLVLPQGTSLRALVGVLMVVAGINGFATHD